MLYRSILIAGLLSVIVTPAIAETGSGIGAGQTTSTTAFELPSGKIMSWISYQFHDMGPGTPLDNTSVDCQSAWIFEADYSAGKTHNICMALNEAGDVLTWSGVGDYVGGKWKILDGTGSFANMTGGGTWTNNAPLPDPNRWSFTWTWDSEWTGE